MTLQNGHAEFNGTVSGSLTSPVIAGHVTANNIVIEKQSIEAFSADVNAASTRGAGPQRDTGLPDHAGAPRRQRWRLHEWKPDNTSAVTATASLQNADITNLLALLGQTQIPVKGSLSAEAQVNGTLADPRATATLRGGKGSAYGEPFDRADRQRDLREWRTAGVHGRSRRGRRKVNLTGAFNTLPTDFLAGTIQANVKTSDVALNQIQNRSVNTSRRSAASRTPPRMPRSGWFTPKPASSSKSSS